MMQSIFMKTVLSAGLLLFFSYVSGQVTGNELDKKYAPNTNSTFNNLASKSKDSYSSSDITIKTAIKFCPTMLARQKAFFLIERKIAGGASIIAGVGKAFGNDGIQSFYLAELAETRSPQSLSPGTILLNSSYSGSSPLISGTLRLYYNGNVFGDGYVDFTFRQEKMRYDLSSTVDGYQVYGSRTASFNMLAYYFGWGYSWVSGNNNNFTHDIYMQTGIKSFQITKYVENQTTFNSTTYAWSPNTIAAKIFPAINIGYVFGVGF
jgi:hypothetical protein